MHFPLEMTVNPPIIQLRSLSCDTTALLTDVIFDQVILTGGRNPTIDLTITLDMDKVDTMWKPLVTSYHDGRLGTWSLIFDDPLPPITLHGIIRNARLEYRTHRTARLTLCIGT